MFSLSNIIWLFPYPEFHPVSGFFPDFSGFFSNLQVSMVLTLFLLLMDGLLLKYDTIVILFRTLSTFRIFSRIFLKSSAFNGCNHISSHNWCFTSQIWCVNLLIQNLIHFLDFFRIFLDIPQIFRFQLVWLYFFT